MMFLVLPISGQTQLSKIVVGNGGRMISNNAYSLNLTIGQSLAAKSISESTDACIGFWYEVRKVIIRPFRLETYTIGQKADFKSVQKTPDLKIYPNPFFERTQIEFELSQSGMTRVSIIDIQGKEVELLLHEYLHSGKYKIGYQTNSKLNGVYTVMLVTEKERMHKSCIILK